MKAWILNQPAPIESRPLVLPDVPAPQPADDEVVVKVSACGVCRTDLHVVEGDLDTRKLPIIPGHQVAGTIEAVGSRVDQVFTFNEANDALIALKTDAIRVAGVLNIALCGAQSE